MRIQYGDSVKGQFRHLVHDICEQEIGVTMEQGRTSWWHWQPEMARAFSGYIALYRVNLLFHKQSPRFFAVTGFDLELDNGHVRFGLSRTQPDSLDNDFFAKDILEQAKDIYHSHNHEVCIELAARDESIEELLSYWDAGERALSA